MKYPVFPQSDPILPNAVAAGYLGITPHTLNVWRCNKRFDIPYIKVGGRVRYRKSSLDNFLLQQTIGETSSEGESA
jgi:hypothetical protein